MLILILSLPTAELTWKGLGFFSVFYYHSALLFIIQTELHSPTSRPQSALVFLTACKIPCVSILQSTGIRLIPALIPFYQTFLKEHHLMRIIQTAHLNTF